jgi:hypothetical protein
MSNTASKKTPVGGLFAYFGKRDRPTTSSTGSSTEGGISQARKMSKVQTEADIEDVRTNLLGDLEEAMDDPAAHEVMENFNIHMEQSFSRFKQEIKTEFQKMFTKMNVKISELETRVKELEMKVEVSGEKELKEIKQELNRQGQYSRKDNLRLFGAEEKDDEECKQVVCNIIAKKLKVKVTPADLSVAHRLPKSKKSKKQKHRPIIVKFKDRTLRQQVLWARKMLKGSGISIGEDLTRENMTLMRDAEESGVFEAVWFSNAKVRAKDKKGKIYILDLFDEFKKYG